MGTLYNIVASVIIKQGNTGFACSTVCFFVSCNRQWFNRVPAGGEPADCLSTLHPYSDAGCADLPLTLLGAPVSIGETRVTVSRLAVTVDHDTMPDSDVHWPPGIRVMIMMLSQCHHSVITPTPRLHT